MANPWAIKMRMIIGGDKNTRIQGDKETGRQGDKTILLIFVRKSAQLSIASLPSSTPS
jgi:hypothetical protein